MLAAARSKLCRRVSAWSGVFASHAFRYICFFKPSFLSESQSLPWIEVNFSNQNTRMPSQPGVFQFGTFLNVALSDLRSILALGTSWNPCNSFSKLFIHQTFLLCSFSFHILLKHSFVYFVSMRWYIFEYFPPTSWQNFLSLFQNILFCLYCLYFLALSWFLLSLPFFANKFLFIFSSCIVQFAFCFDFHFSSQPIPMFSPLSIFVSCCNCLIYVSSLIYLPRFEFLLMFLRVTLILSKTNFTLA